MKIVYLYLVITVSGCFADNLVELATSLGATTLLDYAQKAGLATDLANNEIKSSAEKPHSSGANKEYFDTGPFTIFAPTNAAFAALPAAVIDELRNNTDLLKKVLMFHILDGRTYSSQLSNDLTAQSLDVGLNIRINIYGNIVTADGAKVKVVDQNATNGVIHVIERVMYPFPDATILEKLAVTSELSTLLFYVSQAQLIGALQGVGPFTLFAPTNKAFDALPPGALSDLLTNRTALDAVLEYHVVLSTAYSAGLSSGQVSTIQGGDVQITVSNSGLMVNDATVVKADIPTSNGVIHIIDKIIFPK